MNKGIPIILLLISIICIVIGVFVFPNEPNKQPPVDTRPILISTPDLDYVSYEFEKLEFKDFSVSKVGNEYELFMNILNNGEDLNELKQADIILYNAYGKEISRIFVELIDILRGETVQIVLSTFDDISKTADFKVEFKK